MKNLFDSLKNDLIDSFESRNLRYDLTIETEPMQMLLNAKNYIYNIDPESMAALKTLFNRYADGTDTLLSFAEKIRKGKFILPNT